jgi:hypothetical protein
MPIGNAVEREGAVFVYDEKGRQLFSVASGNQPGDGLKGYTSTTVSVRRGGSIYTYNERGQQIYSTSAR